MSDKKDSNMGILMRTPESKRTYFFRADDPLPEVAANEQLDRRCLNRSCYMPVDEINKLLENPNYGFSRTRKR